MGERDFPLRWNLLGFHSTACFAVTFRQRKTGGIVARTSGLLLLYRIAPLTCDPGAPSSGRPPSIEGGEGTVAPSGGGTDPGPPEPVQPSPARARFLTQRGIH
jgi:hypothetical protein